MMRLQTYAGFSFVAALAVIYHAFSSREQFYPAMVYLSTSKICLVLLLNMGLVIMCIMWQLVKRIFLGSLREAEVERLNEQSWREVMEILFAITIFRQDFSVSFLGMVTALLLIKALHWLAQKRVEYIETTPTVTLLSHIRIVSFMVFLLALDIIFFYSSVKSLIKTWQASVDLFFSFEYMILSTTTVASFIKYIFYISDMLMDGQWEKKAVSTFYLELIRDLLHLSMYLAFFLVIFVNYGVPLHLIRELYETFRNFKMRISDYIRYRRLTSNMNDRFPDATAEELSINDATCIICREEMVTAKKLHCGHLFHVQCLRSWLERQHTCPTCRSLVVPPEGGSAVLGHQHGAQVERNQHGTRAAESSQGLGDAMESNLRPFDLRLQAAAAAAVIYKKSYICPPGNTVWHSRFAMPPQASVLAREASSLNDNEFVPGINDTGSSLQQVSPASHNVLNVQPELSSLEAQERFMLLQIEALQCQLQLLHRQLEAARNDTNLPQDDAKGKFVPHDTKGKSIPSSSLTEKSEPSEGGPRF